jgi:acetylornithine deacetylase/succinyl-diaminopimelate desuccinylase-like protein
LCSCAYGLVLQPAEEPDWKTNPFEMTAVDGYLCGRGTSDNKGPVLAFIYAVKVGRCCGCLWLIETY